MFDAGSDFGRELVTAAEVARLFGVTPRTVHRWIDRGLIPAIRIGGAARGPLRIRRADVEALMAEWDSSNC